MMDERQQWLKRRRWAFVLGRKVPAGTLTLQCLS